MVRVGVLVTHLPSVSRFARSFSIFSSPRILVGALLRLEAAADTRLRIGESGGFMRCIIGLAARAIDPKASVTESSSDMLGPGDADPATRWRQTYMYSTCTWTCACTCMLHQMLCKAVVLVERV